MQIKNVLVRKSLEKKHQESPSHLGELKKISKKKN
jgi:hypothetical protein